MDNFKYVLASNSPRRKELLAGLGLDFEVRVIDGIDESYPSSLPASEVAQYIAEKKAAAYKPTLKADELIITADTVVIVGDDILGKPKTRPMPFVCSAPLAVAPIRSPQASVCSRQASSARSLSPPMSPSSSSPMMRYCII